MRIFLAGASGAIGRRLVPLLIAAGHDVTGMTRSADAAGKLEAAGVRPAIVDVYDPPPSSVPPLTRSRRSLFTN